MTDTTPNPLPSLLREAGLSQAGFSRTVAELCRDAGLDVQGEAIHPNTMGFWVRNPAQSAAGYRLAVALAYMLAGTERRANKEARTLPASFKSPRRGD